MANPEARLQVWSAADYDWLTTATGYPPYEISQLIKGWLAEIGTNPSVIAKATALPSMVKDIDDGDSATSVGWVCSFPQGDGLPTLTTYLHSYSTGNMYMGFTEDWVDDGSFNGYGSGSEGSANASGCKNEGLYDDELMDTSTQATRFLVCWDSTDGEEYISVSSVRDTPSGLSWGWAVFRDIDGNWMTSSTVNNNEAYAFDSGLGLHRRATYSLGPLQPQLPERYTVYRDASESCGPFAGEKRFFTVANPKIFKWRFYQSGTWSTINGSPDIYLSMGFDGLWQRMLPEVFP